MEKFEQVPWNPITDYVAPLTLWEHEDAVSRIMHTAMAQFDSLQWDISLATILFDLGVS
jgi:hypothetical protein